MCNTHDTLAIQVNETTITSFSDGNITLGTLTLALLLNT